MPKVKVYSIDAKKRYKIIGDLFEIIANLKTKKEVVEFLIGLFTSSETLMIARRIQIAKMLLEEKSYEHIRKKLGVGYQTIATIEHWLQADDERKLLIERKIKILQDETGKVRSSSGSLLNKYVHHRFMRELLR